jgi:anti-sigma28 factor (negative regulator of flagellin synthesis)
MMFSRRSNRQPESDCSMRVYNSNIGGGTAAGTDRTQEARGSETAAGKTATSSSAASDRVELSQALGSLARAMSADSASRASRVASLASQYQSGNYQPNSYATSKSMISDALNLGGQ